MTTIAPPPIDPELGAALAATGQTSVATGITLETLAAERAALLETVPSLEDLAADGTLEERRVPARLADPSRRIQVRVEPDGVRTAHIDPPDPRWRSHPVGPDGTGRIVLETDRGASLVDDMVLERAAILAELVIGRVRRPGAGPARRGPGAGRRLARR